MFKRNFVNQIRSGQSLTNSSIISLKGNMWGFEKSFQCTKIGNQSKRFFSISKSFCKKKDPLKHEKLETLDYAKIASSRKRFYVFGSTMNGAVGLSNLIKPNRMIDYEYIHHPVRNFFGGYYNVLDVETGHGFTLIKVKKKGSESTVFGTGLNTHSQLGYIAEKPRTPLKVIIRLAPITIPKPYSNMNVIGMGAGRAHSVISFEGGGMISFGDNSQGQCGRIPIEDEDYFGSSYIYRFPSFTDEDVVSIASKFDITLCVTTSGKVYSFGVNNKGQTGRGVNAIKTWMPQLVEGDLKGENISLIATSGNSVFAVSKKGDLFGWGCNELGLINSNKPGHNIYEPCYIPLPRRIGRVKHACVAEHTSHIVNDIGEVYAWGIGETLGLGPSKMRAQSPTLLPPPLFGANDLTPNTVVEKIFAGFFHVVAINNQGFAYSWGRNESGCLGLGFRPNVVQYFPLRIALAGVAEKASLGVDHTVILCRGEL